MSDDEDLKTLKDFSSLMIRWARTVEGRLGAFDEKMSALAEAQANSEAKIAALADAQIRTEGVVATLGERMAELAAAQAHTDRRMDALIDIVRGMREGTPPQ